MQIIFSQHYLKNNNVCYLLNIYKNKSIIRQITNEVHSGFLSEKRGRGGFTTFLLIIYTTVI